MPVITSWMPNQINSSSAMSLCNCLTQLTCRRWVLSMLQTNVNSLCQSSGWSWGRFPNYMCVSGFIFWQGSEILLHMLLHIGSKWLSLVWFRCSNDWIPPSSLHSFNPHCHTQTESIKLYFIAEMSCCRRREVSHVEVAKERSKKDNGRWEVCVWEKKKQKTEDGS